VHELGHKVTPLLPPGHILFLFRKKLRQARLSRCTWPRGVTSVATWSYIYFVRQKLRQVWHCGAQAGPRRVTSVATWSANVYFCGIF
jgi:hypothetical protein